MTARVPELHLTAIARSLGFTRHAGSRSPWSEAELTDRAVAEYWRNRPEPARPVGTPTPDHIADLCGLRRCGTPAARERHYRRGEQPCAVCADLEATA